MRGSSPRMTPSMLQRSRLAIENGPIGIMLYAPPSRIGGWNAKPVSQGK